MEKLGQFIAREANVPLEKVMLLRHSSSTVKHLKARGISVKHYTEVQPKNSRYDYRRDGEAPIEIVVVIVDDKIDAVYRIAGVEKEGTTYSLNVPRLVEFDKLRARRDRPARRFLLRKIPSASIGTEIEGWERRQRTPVQRQGDRFFDEITVDVPPSSSVSMLPSIQEIQHSLEDRVSKATRDSSAARRKRLAKAERKPERIEIRAAAFIRNADVIVEVLSRAGGKCECCGKPAPFNRKTDNSPYLEVHHRVWLVDGGDDTVENAIALCPNCHRQKHYG